MKSDEWKWKEWMSSVDQVSSEAVAADFPQEKSYANKGGTVTLYVVANIFESYLKWNIYLRSQLRVLLAGVRGIIIKIPSQNSRTKLVVDECFPSSYRTPNVRGLPTARETKGITRPAVLPRPVEGPFTSHYTSAEWSCVPFFLFYLCQSPIAIAWSILL